MGGNCLVATALLELPENKRELIAQPLLKLCHDHPTLTQPIPFLIAKLKKGAVKQILCHEDNGMIIRKPDAPQVNELIEYVKSKLFLVQEKRKP